MNFKRRDELVYSTGIPPAESIKESDTPQIHPARREIVLRIERKGRGGKTVTIVETRDFQLEEVKKIGKELKTLLGTGGTVKGQLIEIQGDHRDRISQYFLKLDTPVRK